MLNDLSNQQKDGNPVMMIENTVCDALVRCKESAKLTDQDLVDLTSTVFAVTKEPIVVTDSKPRILLANQAYCDNSGYALEELIGKDPGTFKSGRHDKAFYESMWNELYAKGEWQGEIWNRRKNGELHPSWLVINAVHDSSRKVKHYVGVFTDITRIKEAEDRLQDLAYHDVLTRLPNRALFYERLKHAFKRAIRNTTKVGLLFLDLDRFKCINDNYGHESGDLLLCETAHRLCRCIRDVDTVARLGGDEFVVVIEDLKDPSVLGVLASKIKNSVSAPVVANGKQFSISASIGISVFPDDSLDYEDLVRNADEAMYRVKQSGRNDFRFFSQVSS